MTDAQVAKLPKLTKDAAAALRSYEADPKAPGAHLLSVKAAESLLAAREHHFTNQDGLADLRGSSYQYRMWLGEVYSQAGITSTEDKIRVGNRLRYTIAQLLRANHPAEELAAYGLKAEDLRTRGIQRRAKRTELVDLIRPGARYDREQLVDAAAVMAVMMRRMTPQPLNASKRGKAANERAAVVADLEDAHALIGELLERLKG